MLKGARILIAEDNFLLAMELEEVVRSNDGVPLGPAATVSGALAIMDGMNVQAAILDVNLADGDIGPVIERLRLKGAAFVIQTGEPRKVIERRYPGISVLSKPINATKIVEVLAKLRN